MTYRSKENLATALETQLHDVDLKSDLYLDPRIGRRNFLKVCGATALVTATSGIETEQNISEAHSIDIPYYRQEGDYNCGVACTQMVLGYLLYPKQPPSQGELVHEVGAPATSADIVGTFWSRGYENVRAFGLSVERLKELISDETPTMALGGFIQPGHWVVPIGYDDRDGEMIVHDPTKGPAIRYKYNLFDNFWTSSENNPGERLGIVVPYKPRRDFLEHSLNNFQEILFGSIFSLGAASLAYGLIKTFSRKK